MASFGSNGFISEASPIELGHGCIFMQPKFIFHMLIRAVRIPCFKLISWAFMHSPNSRYSISFNTKRFHSFLVSHLPCDQIWLTRSTFQLSPTWVVTFLELFAEERGSMSSQTTSSRSLADVDLWLNVEEPLGNVQRLSDSTSCFEGKVGHLVQVRWLDDWNKLLDYCPSTCYVFYHLAYKCTTASASIY